VNRQVAQQLLENPKIYLDHMVLKFEVVQVPGVSDSDHIELCDESGKLINPDDFPEYFADDPVGISSF
jgi:hypothetical protein